MTEAVALQEDAAASATPHASLREVLTLLREDKALHGDWARPGFRALVSYRLGAWRLTKTGLLRKVLYLPMRTFQRYVRNHYGIELSPTASLGRGVWIPHHGAIVIHEYARIGDGVMIRQGCTIGGAAQWSQDAAPVIEDGVELGAGVIIVGPVRIGRGARIGPNVVVTRNVPPGAVVFAPAPRTIETAARGDR
jgi:serine O-acetyltransferase